MKRYFFSVIIAALTAIVVVLNPVEVAGQRGQKSVGLRGGFTTRNTTATAGLYFSYRFTEHFRFASKVDYAFRHNQTDSFSFNFDAEMPISISPTNPGRVNFYPIAGLNYSTFTSHQVASAIEHDGIVGYADSDLAETTDDASQRTNRFGLNLGAGLEFFATSTLRLALEAKCLLMKQYTGGWFNLSIGYVF